MKTNFTQNIVKQTPKNTELFNKRHTDISVKIYHLKRVVNQLKIFKLTKIWDTVQVAL